MTFAQAFRKYRLRSDIFTLSDFASRLSDFGYGYNIDDSTLSRWQKGRRTPTNRKLLLAILTIFIQRGGINSLKEANDFLESGGQGYLTDSEIDLLPKSLSASAPFQVPQEIDHFVGRERHLNKIRLLIREGKTIVICGPAGIGKTALAIKLGHMLRHEFSDGILWFRLDTSSVGGILAAIAYAFGENVNDIKDEEVRASMVRSILSNKKTLLIFDNVEPDSKLHLLFPNSQSCSVIMTTRYHHHSQLSSYKAISLDVFSLQETLCLFESILGKKYTRRNLDKLLAISKTVGNLPLAIHIVAKQLLRLRCNIKQIYKKLGEGKTYIDSLQYEDRNLHTSLNLSYQSVSASAKKVFISLAVFAGHDFSSPAVAYINNLSIQTAKNILEELVNMSLVEKSIRGRFRLHPLIKVFSEEKISGNKLYLRALNYYSLFVKRQDTHNTMNNYPLIERELDNILFLFKKCYKIREWKSIIKIWEYFGIFLWHSGYWNKVGKLGEYVIKAAQCLNDKNAYAYCSIRELSWLYLWQGDLKKAEWYAQLGLKYATWLKDEYLMAFGNKRLGMIYQRNGQYKEALGTLKKALKVFRKLNEVKHLGDTYLYLGHVLRKQNNLDQSEAYYRKSLDTATEIKDQEGVPIALYYLGEIALLKRKYEEAKDYFMKALKLDMNNNRKAGEAWNKWGLGLIELSLGNFEKAKQLFYEAKKVYAQLGMRTNIEQVEKSISQANGQKTFLDKSLLFTVS